MNLAGKEKVYNLDNILRDISIRYLYLIIGIFSFFSAIYWYYDIPLKYVTTACVILHIFFIFVPYRLEYKSLKPLIPIYLVFISLALYPLVVCFWRLGQITSFMWYLLIPLGAMVYFPMKTVIFWGIYIFIIICFSLFISSFIPDSFIVLELTKNQSDIINILVVIVCLCLVYFFVYYINKINQIKMQQIRDQKITNNLLSDDIDKYNDLYISILNYFDKEKPYRDPEFSISQLAGTLDSNVSYISRALNMRKNMNFNIFVNTYRINMVKKMFDEGYHNKFTIRYIYTAAGFRHQSTFNKVFKQIEGINPSEYIHQKVN